MTSRFQLVAIVILIIVVIVISYSGLELEPVNLALILFGIPLVVFIQKERLNADPDHCQNNNSLSFISKQPLKMEEVLLRGSFQRYPECTRFYSVAMTKHNIIIDDKQDTFKQKGFSTISFKDVLVAKVLTSKILNDASGYFQIVFYPLVKSKRNREVVAFRVAEFDSLEENVNIAETWCRTVAWLLRDQEINVESLQAKEQFPPIRTFLILLNPKSGSGRSGQVFKKMVEPMFNDEGSHFEVITTDHSGHGNEIGKVLDVEKYDMVVICSGDGLVHEFYNGLMGRDDWELASTFPFAIIPTGSGNALSAAIFHAANEPLSLKTAVFMALRGKQKTLDCCSITMENRRMFSLLSTTWGLISDIDIESEKYRMLGGARFTVGALARIMGMRSYEGKLSYLPADPSQLAEILELDTADLVNQLLPAGEQEFSDDYRNRRGISTSTFLEDQPSGHTKPMKLSHKSRAVSLPVESQQGHNKDSKSYSSTSIGPSDIFTPSLDKPVPGNWTVIEGQFVTVCALLVSHIGEGMITAPQAELCDSLIHLFFIKKGLSRKSMLSIFTSMENGTHVKNPDLQMAVVKAFRLEPSMSRPGFVAVDGELVEYNAIQGELHPGLARVMSL